jgi:hypothetical protein
MQQSLNALAHLVCGFVRKRDSENIPGWNILLGDQIRNAMRDHSRFARTCSGEDEERPFGSEHGFALLFVQL